MQNYFKNNRKSLKSCCLCLGIGFLLSLSSCIDTPEDAMEHLEYAGLDDYVEHMVEWTETTPILTQVFNDSIFPNLINTVSFSKFAEISEKVKNHSTYKNFTDIKLSEDYVMLEFNKMNPIDASKFYQKYRKTFRDVENLYSEKVFYRNLSKVSFSDALEMSDILHKSPLEGKVATYNFSTDSILSYFGRFDAKDGAKKYKTYHKEYPVMDSVYQEWIIPVIINAPYETITEVSNILKDSKFASVLNESKLAARNASLSQIREEVNAQKDYAIEALDRVIIPSIQLELDSLSQKEADKVTEKFIGGFLNIRELALSFGRDENKFKKLWDEHIHSDKYDEVFDKHIKTLLNDVYASQQELYTQITGANRKKICYEFMSDPILIEYPKDSSLIQKYIKSNKFGYIKSLAEWVPYIGEAITISDTYDMLTENSEEEKLEDKDAFKIFCQQLIIGQIDDKYFENVRSEAIKVIDYSYDQLYKDISKNI